MLDWFHVSEREWALGHQIPTGHWGSVLRSFGASPEFSQDVYRWEMALEVARVVSDKKPSRLDCVFVTESIELARCFARDFRPNGKIYRVQPFDLDVLTFRGDFQLLTGGGSWMTEIPERVKQYWLGTERVSPELLVGGPVVVQELMLDLHPHDAAATH